MDLKRLIMTSPFAYRAKEMQADLTLLKFSRENSKITGNRTVYCISPYKTGTTFLASLYPETIARHEPIHYLSLRKLNKDFDSFFIRRLNTLNLKLECSGYWSAFIPELAAHDLAKDLQYICVLRSPSEWITSLVNFWNMPDDRLQFDYVSELFWKPKVGIAPRLFMEAEESVKLGMIENMITFYFEFTKLTELLKNVHYVWLHEISDFIPELDTMLGESSNFKKSWKRQNPNKTYLYENPGIDTKYKSLVTSLTR